MKFDKSADRRSQKEARRNQGRSRIALGFGIVVLAVVSVLLLFFL